MRGLDFRGLDLFTGELPRLSYDWTLKNGTLNRSFFFNTKEAADNFVSAVFILIKEKLEVKPKPHSLDSTFTEYGGMKLGSTDDGSCVTISLLEDSVITPRDVTVGRKIDVAYESCWHTS